MNDHDEDKDNYNTDNYNPHTKIFDFVDTKKLNEQKSIAQR